MRLLIEPLLNFYDDPGEGENRHASAVSGVIGEDLCAELFKHYLLGSGCGEVTIHSNTPRQSPGAQKRKSKWLDRWMSVTRVDGGRVLYQCEIKNWAASSAGGRCLSVSCSDQQMIDVAKKNWTVQSKDIAGVKQPNALSKVLLPMRVPEVLRGVTVEPALLFWMPLSKATDADPEPFFSVAVSDYNLPAGVGWGAFKMLNIFSASLYLRRLRKAGHKDLVLGMPDASRRMKILMEVVGL